jgi:hypothetical protein
MSKAKKKANFTDADFVIQARLDGIKDAEAAIQADADAAKTKISEQTQGYIDVIKRMGTTPTGFAIEERDIPKRSGRKGVLTYPIADLEPGSKQSFAVPATPETIKNVTSSIRTFAFRHGYKVTLRQEENGTVVRVWRKAVKA